MNLDVFSQIVQECWPPEDPEHLVFMVHGVGGICSFPAKNCSEVVYDFERIANNLLASNPPSRASTPSNNRHLAKHLKKGLFRRTSSNVEPRIRFVCIEWSSCTRKEIGLKERLNLISLSKNSLRDFFNNVILDSLLYSSGPINNQTIMTNVGNEINRLYTLFMENHPNFNGSVSLAGHSLGAVIIFDLLANQLPFEINVPPSSRTSTENGKDISHNHHIWTSSKSDNCMNYTNLEELLKDMDLSQHIEKFNKKQIDINGLLLLSDLDLKELNLPIEARQKLGTYINFKKISIIKTAPGAQQENTQQSGSEMKTKSSNNISDNTGQFLVTYPQLKFKPKCFFAFGSPLSMFLNMRGIQHISKDYKLPTCDRMINIFHPYDPLAYRVEPLIDPRFKNIEPILIPHHKGGKRIHVQLREGFAKVGSNIKHSLLSSLKNTWTSFTRFGAASNNEPSRSSSVDSSSSSSSSKRKKLTKSVSNSVEIDTEQQSIDKSNNNPPKQQQKRQLKRQQLVKSHSDVQVTGLKSIIENSVRQSMDGGKDFEASRESIVLSQQLDSLNLGEPEEGDPVQPGPRPKRQKIKTEDNSVDFDPADQVGRLNNGRRLDYVLQEKPIELFNEYIFAFTSHANYWQNEDSALVILNEIYQVDDGIQMFDFD